MSETPDNSLKLDVDQVGEAAVVRIIGSVSISDADALRSCLEDLTDRKLTTIVLDLTEMAFICSSGLGAIISAHIKARHHKGQIRLVNPRSPVRQLLETTRLTKLFPLYKTVAEAISA